MLINDRLYGQWEVSDPLALSLISLPAFERLHHVGQYGSYWFGLPEANTTRAEHSLGVYYLLKHFGASREEQIAGLLHDISHTVFSHVIDTMYHDSVEQKKQDERHAAVVAQEQIKDVLEAAGFSHERISELAFFPLLDAELPDICCDRLDYFLRDSVCYGELELDEALGILNRLQVVGGKIAVTDAEVGRFITRHSLLMTQKRWGPPWGCFIFTRTAEALRRALELGLVTEEDLYTTDKEVWQKMRQANDKIINPALDDVENIRQLKLCLDENNYDYHFQTKFRVMEPLVLTSTGLRRVTDIFPELAKTIAEERERFNRGHFVKVVRD